MSDPITEACQTCKAPPRVHCDCMPDDDVVSKLRDQIEKMRPYVEAYNAYRSAEIGVELQMELFIQRADGDRLSGEYRAFEEAYEEKRRARKALFDLPMLELP